jgi:hypothetical protein
MDSERVHHGPAAQLAAIHYLRAHCSLADSLTRYTELHGFWALSGFGIFN